MAGITAGGIAGLVKGELHGDASRSVTGVGPLETVGPEGLSFVASAKYLPYLQATRAGIVLVRRDWLDAVPEGCVAIVVGDPHLAMRSVLTEIHPAVRPPTGIHPTAVVGEGSKIAADASVGPYAVIGEDTEIGSGAVVAAHVVVGGGCRLGRDVTIHAHVTLHDGVRIGDRVIVRSGARIGSDGFGYVWSEGGHRKVPQVGGCVIEDDVEIGANATIDRGSVGDTVIGRGSKIDNLVHVGHNVAVGSHVILVAQTGISGSTQIGDGAVLGGQVGVAGHLAIGAGARLGAQAGVISDVPPGETYSGYPARPHREAMRAQAGIFKLSEMLKRLKRLESAVFDRIDERMNQQ